MEKERDKQRYDLIKKETATEGRSRKYKQIKTETTSDKQSLPESLFHSHLNLL